MKIDKEEHRTLLRPVPWMVCPRRDLLIDLFRRDGRFRLSQIGGHFHLAYPAVSRAKARAEAYLRTNKRPQRRFRISI